MTFCHYIRPNHSCSSPSTHLVVDCESVEAASPTNANYRTQSLRLWSAERLDFRSGVLRRRRGESGTDGNDFWLWVRKQLSPDRQTWLWAHNATVDMTWLGLWRQIDCGNIELKSVCLGNPPFIVDVTINGRQLKIVDSLNWFRSPLADVASSLGMQKLPMPLSSADEDSWLKYCIRDTEILGNAVTSIVSLVRTNRLGRLRPTVPGQAWHSWRHQNTGVFPLVHGRDDVSAIERDSYFGGRTSVFFQGSVRADRPLEKERVEWERLRGPTLWGQRVHIFDARGFYPAVMRAYAYPWKLIGDFRRLPLGELEQLCTNYGVIAQVKVETQKNVYPVRRDGETFYPVGQYWTTLAAPELRWAFAAGDITDCARILVYEQAYLFRDWVEKLWSLRSHYRSTGQLAFELCVKVLLNSLFGKFGQRSREWKWRDDHPCRERWGEWAECDANGSSVLSYRGLAGRCQHREPDGEWSHAFVAIPSHVCSMARVLAREWIEVLPKHSLLYHDTDSLHVTEAGRQALEKSGFIDKEAIGGLRLIGTYNSAEYLAPKLYRIDDSIVAAGIPRNSVGFDAWRWRYDNWESLRSIIQRGPVDDIQIREVIAEANPKERIGRVAADGWVSPPLLEDVSIPF